MKAMEKFIIDETGRKETEVRSAMQGFFRAVIGSCGGKRFTSLLIPALMVLVALALVFAPSSAFAAGSNNITGWTDESPTVEDKIKTRNDVLMMSVTTSKSAQGSDLSKAIMTLSGIGLNKNMVDVVIANVAAAGGAENVAVQDGHVTPGTLSNFSINLNGSTLGGETWYFYINLNDTAAPVTNLQLTLTSLTGSDNATLPKTTAGKPIKLGCLAVAPSDVSLTSKTDSSVVFNWTHDSNNVNYNIYRDAGGGSMLYNSAVSPSENPYTDSGIGVANKLTPLTKYAYVVRGYESTNYCESADSNILITQTKSDNKFQIYTCGGCHTTPPDDAPSKRGTPDGGTIGRHANPYHTGGVKTGTEVCIWCHTDPGADPAHRDKKIGMNTTAIYGYSGSFYDKNRNGVQDAGDDHFDQNNKPIVIDNALTENGTCVNTWCHGSRGASPVWGYSSGNSQCNLCHGMYDGMKAYDTEGDTSPTDEQMGAHNSHLHLGNYVAPPDPSDFMNISTANTCTECHHEPATHESVGHYDTPEPAEINFGTMSNGGGVLNPQYDPDTGKCTNTYCHDGRNFANQWANSSMVTDPVWFDDTYLNSGGNTDNCTNKCHGYPPMLDHVQDMECASCHEHLNPDNITYKEEYYYKHIDGTVQGLNCTDCHGKPPTDDASLANTATLGWTLRSTNYTSAAGAHSEHNTAGVNCSGCHEGGQPSGGQHNNSEPSDVNIGFTAAGIPGEYTAPAIENSASYILNEGGSTTVTETGTGGDPRTCDNIYCHSDGGDYADAYTFTQFDWDSTSGTTCTSCHDDPPTTDEAHGKHATTYSYLCYECHNQTVDSAKAIIGNHVNVVKDIGFGNLGSGTGGAYDTPATGQCDNVYCHSDGKDSPEYADSPVWDQTTTCMSCHGGPNGTTGVAGTSLGGSHTAHTDATGYLCTDCHNKVVDAANSIIGYSLHVKGIKNVAIMVANGGDGTNYDSVAETCSSTNCHGTTSPAWGTAGDPDCGTCHGTNALAGAVPPDTGGSSSATDDEVGAHSAHLTSASNYTDDIGCSECHTVPATVDASGHIDSGHPAEVPLEGSLARAGLADARVYYDSGNGECSNTYCHDTLWSDDMWGGTPGSGAANRPAWTDDTYLDGTKANDCAQCHGNPPVGGHDESTDCKGCHLNVNATNDGFEGPAGITMHMNGFMNAVSCTGCHGQPPMNVDSLVNAVATLGLTERNSNYSNAWGAHVLHKNTLGMSCVECHRGGQGTTGGQHNGDPATILNIGIIVEGVEQGFYQAPDFANSNYSLGGYNDTTVSIGGSAGDPRVCANTYCHGTSSPRWNRSENLGCAQCHGTGAQGAVPPDTGGSSSASDDEVGAHELHLRTSAYVNSNSIQCEDCHTVPSAWDDSGHIDNGNPAEVPLDGDGATDFGAIDTAWTYYDNETGTCYNVYCHDNTAWGVSQHPDNGLGFDNTPSWTNTSYIVNTVADCYRCHGYPPGGSHSADADCNSCHDHVDTDNESFDGVGNKELHLDHVVQGGCCHSPVPPVSGKHTEHIGSTYWVSDSCDTCHGAGATTGSHADHDDLTNTVVTTGGSNISIWTGSATKNCTNDCHLPANLNWTSGTLVCANCHASGYIGVGNPPATLAAHAPHESSSYTAANCTSCHDDNTGTHTALDGTSPSVNGINNITTYTSGNGQCSNDCHVGSNTDFRDSDPPMDCADCHASSYIGIGYPPATLTAHAPHESSSFTAANCVSCHPDNTSSHDTIDGTVSTGGGVTNITTYVSTTNCTNDCHANNGADFSDNNPAIGCDDCHASGYIGIGYPPTTAVTAAHDKHQSNTDYVTADCVDCHNDNSSSHSTIDGTATSPTEGPEISAYSSGTCTNTCHDSTANADFRDSNPKPSCADCHTSTYIGAAAGATPTTGLHDMSAAGVTSHDDTLPSTGCEECHTSTPSSSHLNGAYVSSYPTITVSTAGSIVSFNDGTPPTCSADCHLDSGDWERLWSTAADSTSTTPGNARCDVCHGQYASMGTGWTAGTSHVFNATRGDTQHTDGGSRECDECHAYVADGTKHENDLITLSSNGATPVRANGDARCEDCHAEDGTHDYPVSGFSTETVSGPGYAGGECISCHDTGGSGTTGPNSRRAVVAEFNMTWGHRNSSRASVANEDCGVCHMEGDPATGNTESPEHNNGVIELRDPDSGNEYTSVNFTSGESFVRDVGTDAVETRAAEVQGFCLACHDGGTIHANARTPSGDEYNPWNSAAPTDAVDVNSHFDTSNASFHPVRGVQDNSYCNASTMVAPWSQGDHDLITCFDCHNATSELTEGTIVAHGGSVTLRAAYTHAAATTTPLCEECHKASVYWGGGSVPTASAFDGSLDEATHPSTAGSVTRHDTGEARFIGCVVCHGSSDTAGRTERAEDVHGFDTLVGAGDWPAVGDASFGARPWAFMRNTEKFVSWRPRIDGQTNGFCDATLCISKSGMNDPYQPGGTY